MEALQLRLPRGPLNRFAITRKHSSLAQCVQMTGCPQIYLVFGNRRSGENPFGEIVARQNLQFVVGLDDRNNAAHGGKNNLVAGGNEVKRCIAPPPRFARGTVLCRSKHPGRSTGRRPAGGRVFLDNRAATVSRECRVEFPRPHAIYGHPLSLRGESPSGWVGCGRQSPTSFASIRPG